MKINWGAAKLIVSVVIYALAFSFLVGSWYNDVNRRLDGLETRMDNLESRMESVESEIRELRAIIEERLPPPAPQ